MKKGYTVLLLLFFLFFNTMFAQNILLVENTNLKEKYNIEEGDYIKILYTGYLDQFAEQKSHVDNITETMLYLNSTKSPVLVDDDRFVNIRDIKGIKKLWKYEKFARPVITLGVTIGSYFYFDSDHYSSSEQLIYTSLVSISTGLLLNFIFDDTIEHKISKGWTISFSSK